MTIRQRSYKLRIYPTAEQVRQLSTDFGVARWAWNACLAWRTYAWEHGKERVTAVDFSRELTFLKSLESYSWLKDANSTVITQKLRDQDRAFANFFAQRAKFPRFKRKHSAQSVRYQLDQRQVVNMFRAGELLKLPKLGALKVRWSRLPAGIPKMVTITRDAAGRCFASFMVEEEIAALPARTNGAGADFGVKDVVVTSGGWKSGNPRHLKSLLRSLKHQQRTLSRMKKGSSRWKKQKQKVARLHARISDARRDFLHKTSSKLVRENQAVAIEDLNVKGMIRNRRLAQAISDVGMAELRHQLEYKAQWYGRDLYIADRFAPTSKTCSACGSYQAEMPLKIREWTCPDCGTIHDRDINAAKNILMFATAGSAGNYARGAGKTPSAAAATAVA